MQLNVFDQKGQTSRQQLYTCLRNFLEEPTMICLSQRGNKLGKGKCTNWLRSAICNGSDASNDHQRHIYSICIGKKLIQSSLWIFRSLQLHFLVQWPNCQYCVCLQKQSLCYYKKNHIHARAHICMNDVHLENDTWFIDQIVCNDDESGGTRISWPILLEVLAFNKNVVWIDVSC